MFSGAGPSGAGPGGAQIEALVVVFPNGAGGDVREVADGAGGDGEFAGGGKPDESVIVPGHDVDDMGAFGDIGPDEGERGVGDGAVGIDGGDGDGDVAGIGDSGVVGRVGDAGNGRVVAAVGQFEVEAQVAAVHGGLVDFDAEDVDALDEIRGVDNVRAEGVFGAGAGGGEGQVSDRAGRHVAAEDFHAVEIHDRAIVADEAEDEVGEGGRVGGDEGLAEVGGDVFVRGVGAVAHFGDFVAVSETELRRAAGPAIIVVFDGAPGVALIRAVVELLPDGTHLHQGGRARRPGQEEGQTDQGKEAMTMIHL